MTTTARKLLTIGLLSFCAMGLSVQAQTASPGPNSRNANVDKEDPNKPDTPEHEIPNQEAPGSGNHQSGGAAGTLTPTGGDGSVATENRDPTQPIQSDTAKQNNAERTKQDCEALTGSEKEMCQKALERQTDTIQDKNSVSTQDKDTADTEK